MRSLGEDRIHPILMFFLPKTLKQLRAYRIWILEYADLARSLYQILKEAQKDNQPFIEWDDKSENAFCRLKKGSYDSSHPGSPSTRQVSITCL
jgi:hypothetical protein